MLHKDFELKKKRQKSTTCETWHCLEQISEAVSCKIMNCLVFFVLSVNINVDPRIVRHIAFNIMSPVEQVYSVFLKLELTEHGYV